jgi:hypothetical protein
MKRVMCIDDAHWVVPGLPCPKFGEITTVSWEGVSFSGIPAYSFLEYPTPPGYDFRYFSQKYFVELSDIDETELMNNEKVIA